MGGAGEIHLTDRWSWRPSEGAQTTEERAIAPQYRAQVRGVFLGGGGRRRRVGEGSLLDDALFLLRWPSLGQFRGRQGFLRLFGGVVGGLVGVGHGLSPAQEAARMGAASGSPVSSSNRA